MAGFFYALFLEVYGWEYFKSGTFVVRLRNLLCPESPEKENRFFTVSLPFFILQNFKYPDLLVLFILDFPLKQ
jgi:hypothetical protein